jgi:hypothetical protein
VFVLLYSEFIELATINRFKTVSIRVSRIEPDPYIRFCSKTSVFKNRKDKVKILKKEVNFFARLLNN